jgi:putative phage-type endonuclease
MIIDLSPQGSPEWLQARVGRLTASAVADIYGTRKDGKETAARRDLRVRLALERITGRSQESGYVNADMQRGTELEPLARAAYEMNTGRSVTETGFIYLSDPPVGCSPDGLVGDDGLVEIKCPRAATHIETLERGTAPDDYVPQMLHQLWITGRDWVDFVSFCPDMPEELQVAIIRVEANDLTPHGSAVLKFLGEVDAEEARIRALRKGR